METARNAISLLSFFVLPLILVGFPLYGLYKRVPVYESFVEGAKDGYTWAAGAAVDIGGYKVLDVRDGSEAFLLSQGYQGPIHIMVTDVIMPIMNGPQVAELIATAHDLDLHALVEERMGAEVIDELAGSRIAVANLEVRAPLLGLLTGDLVYGRVPIEAIAFADIGDSEPKRSAPALRRPRCRFRRHP